MFHSVIPPTQYSSLEGLKRRKNIKKHGEKKYKNMRKHIKTKEEEKCRSGYQ